MKLVLGLNSHIENWGQPFYSGDTWKGRVGIGLHWEQNKGIQRDGLPILIEHVFRISHGTGPDSFSEVVPPPESSLIKKSMVTDKNNLGRAYIIKT